MDRAPEVFAQETTVKEYKRRVRDLEQLLGKKEAASGQEGGGDRPSKKLLGPERLSVAEKVALVSGTYEAYGPGAVAAGGGAGALDPRRPATPENHRGLLPRGLSSTINPQVGCPTLGGHFPPFIGSTAEDAARTPERLEPT